MWECGKTEIFRGRLKGGEREGSRWIGEEQPWGMGRDGDKRGWLHVNTLHTGQDTAVPHDGSPSHRLQHCLLLNSFQVSLSNKLQVRLACELEEITIRKLNILSRDWIKKYNKMAGYGYWKDSRSDRLDGSMNVSMNVSWKRAWHACRFQAWLPDEQEQD